MTETCPAYTLSESGTNQATTQETGNSLTADYSRAIAGSDTYTLTEAGTNAYGSYSETVAGNDAYTQTETGNTLNQTFSRSTSGTGTYTRQESGPGGSQGPWSDSLSYTLQETGDSRAGLLSQSETGCDRYGLLEQFDDVANTGSGSSPGHLDFSPFGMPFTDPPTGPEGENLDDLLSPWAPTPERTAYLRGRNAKGAAFAFNPYPEATDKARSDAWWQGFQDASDGKGDTGRYQEALWGAPPSAPASAGAQPIVLGSGPAGRGFVRPSCMICHGRMRPDGTVDFSTMSDEEKMWAGRWLDAWAPVPKEYEKYVANRSFDDILAAKCGRITAFGPTEFFGGVKEGALQTATHPWQIVTGPVGFLYNAGFDRDQAEEDIHLLGTKIIMRPGRFAGEQAGSAIVTAGLFKGIGAAGRSVKAWNAETPSGLRTPAQEAVEAMNPGNRGLHNRPIAFYESLDAKPRMGSLSDNGFGQPYGTPAPSSAATPNLRDAALAIHNAADPARLRQSAVVVQSVRTAEGVELRAASSAGYFTREQQAVAQRLGIRMVTSRPPRTPGIRRPHAEDILEAHLHPGETVEGWGISWSKQQLPLPCHECNNVVNRLGGWIDFFGTNE